MGIIMKQGNSDNAIACVWSNIGARSDKGGVKWINIGIPNTRNKF